MTTTTATVAYSSVLSMPSNASDESAANPAGPVTAIDSPSGRPESAVCRIWSTLSPARAQPSSPRLSGTIVWAA